MLESCTYASQDTLVQVTYPCCVPCLLQKEESGLRQWCVVMQEYMADHRQKHKTTKQHSMSEQRLASDSQHSTSRQSSMQ